MICRFSSLIYCWLHYDGGSACVVLSVAGLVAGAVVRIICDTVTRFLHFATFPLR